MKTGDCLCRSTNVVRIHRTPRQPSVLSAEYNEPHGLCVNVDLRQLSGVFALGLRRFPPFFQTAFDCIKIRSAIVGTLRSVAY